MLLAVDIGNTSTLFGVYDGEELLQTFRTKTGNYTDENMKQVKYKIDSAAVSSVVPSVNAMITEVIKRIFLCEVFLLDSKKKSGLKICTDYPEKVGADIICGATAAFNRYRKAVVVFDLGTAATVCAVDSSGNYLGHSIYPGVRTSFDALHRAAEQLPEIDENYTVENVIGKNTIESIKSGVLVGAACFIDGMSERYKEELGEETEIVVTGGLSSVILPFCRGKYIFDSNLLLDGLRMIYNLNSEIDKRVD